MEDSVSRPQYRDYKGCPVRARGDMRRWTVGAHVQLRRKAADIDAVKGTGSSSGGSNREAPQLCQHRSLATSEPCAGNFRNRYR